MKFLALNIGRSSRLRLFRGEESRRGEKTNLSILSSDRFRGLAGVGETESASSSQRDIDLGAGPHEEVEQAAEGLM